MFKEKLLTIAVLAAVSFAASANSNIHGLDGVRHQQKLNIKPSQSTSKELINGLSPTLIKNYSLKQRVSRTTAKSSADGITPDQCTTAEFAQYSGADLVEYVSNAHLIGDANNVGYDCFRVFFEDNSNASTIFSSSNVDAVATALIADLNDGNLEREMYGKVMYLRGMYYSYAMLNSGITLPDETKIKQALDLINSTYLGSSDDLVINKLLSETAHTTTSYYLAENLVSGDTSRIASFVSVADSWVNVLNTIKAFHTDNFSDSYQYSLYYLANSLMQSIDLLISFSDRDSVYNHATLPNVLAEYSWNVTVESQVDTNALTNLTFMFKGSSISNEVITAVQSVIDNVDRFSSQHIGLLAGIDSFDVDCKVFERDSSLCATDELVTEMRDYALPNTWRFGDITFITQMTKKRSYHIYNSLKATRSQFFRDTGITKAVANDPNAQSTFVIYGSPADYQAFHSYLYGLSSDNGGIYIEQDGTLYTFDRPETDMFVLEELARHEYAHYLISRYLVNGMWGETSMYDDNRMVWFDEGLANYFTSATQHDGTAPLATMIDMKSWSDTSRTINEITNTTYSDGWMYPYSAILFNYLEDIGSNALVDLSSALVANDVVKFDSIVSNLSSHNSGFQTYADSLTTDGWQAPWWTYKTKSQLEESSVDTIQTSLSEAFTVELTCNEVSDEFSCSFALESTQVSVINSILDAGIVTALQTGPNNIETMTCHPTEIGSTAECIGLLRPDNVDYENADSDGDGVPDKDDAFPNDPTEWADTDGDGVGDNADAFPNDPTETADTDGDGVGNNADAFPNDATETADTDGDGVGDNADAFPNDATETVDSDGDGVGDNADVFPNDATETVDSDGDGVGDNTDAFPNDATETVDSDGDGHGDNSDYYPNDASKWQQETTPVVTPSEAKSSSGGGSFSFSIIAMMLIGFTRYRKK